MTHALFTAFFNARRAAGDIENETIRDAALKALDAADDAIATATAKAYTITVDDDGLTVTAPTGESQWHPSHKRSAVEALHPFAAVVDNRKPVPPRPTKVQLHLNSAPLTRSERSAIQEIGGEYTACRGHSNRRFVTIPLSGEGRRLADRLVARHATRQRTVAVLRHFVDRDGNRLSYDPSLGERVVYIPNGTSFSDCC